MARCRDPEHWGPVSPWREFDLTPCFEEAALISGLLGAVLLFSVGQTLRLVAKPRLERSRKSNLLLRGKLVSSSFLICNSANGQRHYWP